MKMKLIRMKPSGNEYAMPESKYSELPCFRVQDGKPQQTNFSYGELDWMLDMDRAEVVGEVTLTFTLECAK